MEFHSARAKWVKLLLRDSVNLWKFINQRLRIPYGAHLIDQLINRYRPRLSIRPLSQSCGNARMVRDHVKTDCQYATKRSQKTEWGLSLRVVPYLARPLRRGAYESHDRAARYRWKWSRDEVVKRPRDVREIVRASVSCTMQTSSVVFRTSSIRILRLWRQEKICIILWESDRARDERMRIREESFGESCGLNGFPFEQSKGDRAIEIKVSSRSCCYNGHSQWLSFPAIYIISSTA